MGTGPNSQDQADNSEIIKKLSKKVKELRKSLEKSGVNVDEIDNGIEEENGQIMATGRGAAAAVDLPSDSTHGSK